MTVLVADCPRCGVSNITFDVKQQNPTHRDHGWQLWAELFCVCRHCHKATLFVVSQNTGFDPKAFKDSAAIMKIPNSVNDYFSVKRYISVKDEVKHLPPAHIPPDINLAFNEAATCLSVECWNAAGVMFRQCIDLATKPMLPPSGQEVEGLSKKQRRDLGLRLQWLFDNGIIPSDLKTLSTCIREDGNDAAHDGTLEEEDALDLQEFTVALLERLYTEPEKLNLAEKRRVERRSPKTY